MISVHRHLFRPFLVLLLLWSAGVAGAEARLHPSTACGALHGHPAYVRSSHNRRYLKARRKSKRHFVFRQQPQVGCLFVSETGETICDTLSDVEFNPASVAKLVTAYGAIKTFGLEHRFATTLSSDGKLDEATGVLTGNLYLEGNDPDFDKNDALNLRQRLADCGIKRITGKLVASPEFSFGSVGDPTWSAKNLARILSGRGKDRVVLRGATVGKSPEGARIICRHESEPLRETLKEMLSYSLNNVAEQIGRCAGGVQRLEEMVSAEAGLESGALKLASASGLGKNRVKPKDMLLVIKSLRSELKRSGLDLQDICPVAGVDPGTLDERFTDPSERGSVVAKTGTLPGTDGGASALAGMFRTQKDDVYFVIFCWRGSVNCFRQQQDELIRRMQAARGGPKQFQYKLSQVNAE